MSSAQTTTDAPAIVSGQTWQAYGAPEGCAELGRLVEAGAYDGSAVARELLALADEHGRPKALELVYARMVADAAAADAANSGVLVQVEAHAAAHGIRPVAASKLALPPWPPRPARRAKPGIGPEVRVSLCALDPEPGCGQKRNASLERVAERGRKLGAVVRFEPWGGREPVKLGTYADPEKESAERARVAAERDAWKAAAAELEAASGAWLKSAPRFVTGASGASVPYRQPPGQTPAPRAVAVVESRAPSSGASTPEPARAPRAGASRADGLPARRPNEGHTEYAIRAARESGRPAFYAMGNTWKGGRVAARAPEGRAWVAYLPNGDTVRCEYGRTSAKGRMAIALVRDKMRAGASSSAPPAPEVVPVPAPEPAPEPSSGAGADEAPELGAALEAYCARLVYGPKADYARAYVAHVLEGAPAPADPGASWAEKVRGKVAYYQRKAGASVA